MPPAAAARKKKKTFVHAVKADEATLASMRTASDAAYGKEPVVVYMYAKWCGHCTAMKPAMAETISALRRGSTPMTVMQVESDVVRPDGGQIVADLLGLGRPNGYPYLAYVGPDLQVQEFEGADRSARSLQAFIRDAADRDAPVTYLTPPQGRRPARGRPPTRPAPSVPSPPQRKRRSPEPEPRGKSRSRPPPPSRPSRR